MTSRPACGSREYFCATCSILGCPPPPELLDPITPRNTSPTSFVGPPSVHVPPSRRPTARWPRDFPCRSGFKTAPTAPSRPPSMPPRRRLQPHTFLGINLDGAASAIVTRGNPNCHIVLRGGSTGPNYSPAHIAQAEQLLAKAGLIKAVLVDCCTTTRLSNPSASPKSCAPSSRKIAAGNTFLIGAMVESNLRAGSQPFPQPRDKLLPGVSITDGCIDWDTTGGAFVREVHAAPAPRVRDFQPGKGRKTRLTPILHQRDLCSRSAACRRAQSARKIALHLACSFDKYLGYRGKTRRHTFSAGPADPALPPKNYALVARRRAARFPSAKHSLFSDSKLNISRRSSVWEWFWAAFSRHPPPAQPSQVYGVGTKHRG